MLTKVDVARAQLGTALELFIRDRDPVSVHCLVCGAGEVLDGIAKNNGIEPFSTQMLREHPRFDAAGLRRIRNQYWNAFKHMTTHSGVPRDDQALLDGFDDTKNDAALLVGWTDYVAIRGTLPIAAQVFQIWWYALNEDKLGEHADFEAIRKVFPSLVQQSRVEQKRRLRRVVEKWRNDSELLNDKRTEPHLRRTAAPTADHFGAKGDAR